MAYTFDAANKLIILSLGTVSMSVRDVYSRWKEWVQTSDNSKYLPAFSTTGGDPIDESAGTSIPAYMFLTNGWRIRPQEASHTLRVYDGVLVVAGGGDPFVNTTGSYIVRINYSQPVQAITVSTGGGSGAPTAEENAAAILAAAQITPIHSDVRKANGDPVAGHGIPPTYANQPVPIDPGDPWRRG